MTENLSAGFCFFFPNCGFQEEWIESVGSIHGIVNQFSVYGALIADWGEELLCFQHNDTVRWVNPNYNDCYYVSVGINENNRTSLIIFPNPFTESSILKLPENFGIWNWKLYNSLGQTVQEFDNIIQPELTIKRNELPDGVYFYRVNSGNKTSSGKLIIR